MGKNNRYRISLSCGGGRKLRSFKFKYSSFEVSLTLYESGFLARYDSADKPKTTEFDRNRKEIVYKCLLLLLLNTGKCRESYIVKFEYDGKVKNRLSFVFLEAICDRSLANDDCDKLVEIICHKTRSNYPASVVCYINYALSGAKKSSNSFRNLFQAFNTFYSNYKAYGGVIKNQRAEEKKEDISERKKITTVIDHFFHGTHVELLGKKGNNELCKNVDLSAEKSVFLALRKRFGDKGRQIDERDYHSFVICCYSYYLRCKYFHGEKSMPIISSKGDPELKSLDICNKDLTKFLYDNIHYLIDWDYSQIASENGMEDKGGQ